MTKKPVPTRVWPFAIYMFTYNSGYTETHATDQIFLVTQCSSNSPVLLLTIFTQLHTFTVYIAVSLCHRGGRIQKINAWYLNTHMVYL